MKQTTQPTINLVVLFILTIAAGVLFYFTQQQQAKVRLLTAEVSQLENNRQKLDSLRQEVPSLSLETRSWLDALPRDETAIARFAAELERIAREQRLTIVLDFDDFPGPIDVSGKYIDGLGSQISLEGTFQGVTNFLGQLSAIPYYYKIDKITLTKPDSQPGVKAVINGAIMMSLE